MRPGCARAVGSAASSQHHAAQLSYYVCCLGRFLEDGASGEERMEQECGFRHAGRRRRALVVRPSDETSDALVAPPFDAAPTIYAYNVP